MRGTDSRFNAPYEVSARRDARESHRAVRRRSGLYGWGRSESDGPEAGALRERQVFIGTKNRPITGARFIPPPPG